MSYKLEYRGNGLVIHFLGLLNEQDDALAEQHVHERTTLVLVKHRLAINKSRKYGGKGYTNRSFGGGVYFPSTDKDKVTALCDRIREEYDSNNL
jgi:hypothetical protein